MLGIPAIYDRVCQQALLNRLEPIFEPVSLRRYASKFAGIYLGWVRTDILEHIVEKFGQWE